MEFGTGVSLALYFIVMIGIGLYGLRESTSDTSGYLLGGRKLGPAVTSLSAGASDMSGWMLLGLPGAMFVSGLSSSWIAIGLLIGALLNYILVAPRLRVYTERARDAITIPDYFEKRFEDNSRLLRVVSSIVIVVFFTLYTSSGVVAGGKLFESAFGLSYSLGLFITAGVVVLYTMLGGFMAVSITDFVQGCIMFIALVLVPLVAFTGVGGGSEFVSTIEGIDPNLLNIFSGMTALGIISLMSWGLGYFGQPHIIVRFMAIRSVKDIATARNIGMSWMLAAILAAIMSTISSQLLVSSSSLTEDFYKIFLRRNAQQKELVLVGRISVVVVALVAIGLAFDRNSTVLGLVSNAWAGFGAAFGPVVLLSLFWKRMTRWGALFGMIAGAVTVLVWVYVLDLSGVMYEIVPGFLICTVTVIVVSLMTAAPKPRIEETFDAVEVELNEKLG